MHTAFPISATALSSMTTKHLSWKNENEDYQWLFCSYLSWIFIKHVSHTCKGKQLLHVHYERRKLLQR